MFFTNVQNVLKLFELFASRILELFSPSLILSFLDADTCYLDATEEVLNKVNDCKVYVRIYKVEAEPSHTISLCIIVSVLYNILLNLPGI